MKKCILLLSLFFVCLLSYGQKWKPIYEGSNINYDSKYKYKDVEWNLDNGGFLKVKDWNDYLRDFIFSLPEISRDMVCDGLTRYYIQYDRVDKVIEFEPLRFATKFYANNPYIAFVGNIKDKKAVSSIKFMYRGIDWVFINSVKIVTDNNTYEIDVDECSRQTVGRGLTAVAESFTIECNNSNKEMIKDICESKESIIRFIGKNNYSDYIVQDNVKGDLKAMLEAINVLQ